VAFLVGAFLPDNLDTFTAYLDRLCVQSYCYPENFARLERTRQLAEQRGATLAQIAMAYVLAQPFLVFPLVGCANGAEYAANAAAFDVALSAAEDRLAGAGRMISLRVGQGSRCFDTARWECYPVH
jgi:aryl-alcohol dehydrogenase-like predicted oxidoreductase